MSQSPTILSNPTLKPSENYVELRKAGIDFLQKLSGKIWTDYNIHDPGLTIHELLCYAITDLGYRTNFSMTDLLTETGNENPTIYKRFITAKHILPCNPITLNDFRKLIIDIKGIKNAYIEAIDDIFTPNIYVDAQNQELTFVKKQDEGLMLDGLYRVKIELEKIDKIQPNVIKNEVIKALQAHRNLCEDFLEIDFFKEENVAICADIELEKDVPFKDLETILTKIYQKIDQYISPRIQQYSLTEMLDKGKKIEEIFEGPLLNNGFIDEEDLEKFARRDVILTSDLINLIIDDDVKGIVAIKKIFITRVEQDLVTKEWKIKESQTNCMHLNDAKNDVFHFIPAACKVHFFKGFLPLPVVDVKEIPFVIPPSKKMSMNMPKGRFRNIDNYLSIQNEFPHNYHVGKEGISDKETPLRKAQRLQLKAYLLFSEQLLANYFSQLYHLKDLFSWEKIADNQTYFFNELHSTEIKDLDVVLDKTEYGKVKTAWEVNDNNLDRRNRFLDNLLAQFNERFSDYALIKYTHSDTLPADLGKLDQEIIEDKISFLEHYKQISSRRSKAFNYTKHSWNTSNVSGFERRISKILGINDDSRHELGKLDEKSDFNKAGFHLIEHILLRPKNTTDALLPICCFDEEFQQTINDTYCSDPYSMRVTLVFPGWLKVCENVNFRRFAEEIIREEAPAHVALKICWISQAQMVDFEKAFQEWLDALRIGVNYSVALKDFVEIFKQLRNIYPKSYLHDCEVSAKEKTPFILGHGFLGTTN